VTDVLVAIWAALIGIVSAIFGSILTSILTTRRNHREKVIDMRRTLYVHLAEDSFFAAARANNLCIKYKDYSEDNFKEIADNDPDMDRLTDAINSILESRRGYSLGSLEFQGLVANMGQQMNFSNLPDGPHMLAEIAGRLSEFGRQVLRLCYRELPPLDTEMSRILTEQRRKAAR